MAFQDFARVWTPIALSAEVGRKPLRRMLAGEPVVLFRGADGRAGALVDRCPHRGVALSLGRVTDDGVLECPFHGWRFDVDGRNRGVPLNPDARCETLGAQALAVRELGELIWVYTAPDVTDAPEPDVPPSLTDPGLMRTYLHRDWACHWTRAMENMLDSPHLPFVHRRTIGRVYRRRMTATSRMDIDWEETPFGGRAKASLDGHFGGGFLEFYRPNVMALHIPIPGRRLLIHALVIPTEEGRTRLTVVAARDFAKVRLLEPIFRRMNGRIADEDQAVVESSGSAPVPPANQEHSVASDRATLQFRRYYYGTLKGSEA